MAANHSFDGWRSIDQSRNLRMDRTHEPWRVSAACQGVNTSVFYPFDSNSEDVDRAKAICATCPVREECLEHAMRWNEQYGVWGGLTENERASLRRRRYRGAA